MGDSSGPSRLDHREPSFVDVKTRLQGKTLRIPNLREILANWPLEVNIHANVLETAVEGGLVQYVYEWPPMVASWKIRTDSRPQRR